MKNVILKYGLLSGIAAALLMWAMLPFVDDIGFEYGTILGYTGIVISLLFVYFGIRSYRDTVLDGRIGFLRAAGVGMAITLISGVFYVLAWEVMYYNFMPDFVDKYSTYVIGQLKAQGAPQAEIDTTLQQLEQFRTMSRNPLTLAAITILEPLPVGILITLISAVLLRRTKPRAPAGTVTSAAS